MPVEIVHLVTNRDNRRPGATVNGVVLHCTTAPNNNYQAALQATLAWFSNLGGSASAHIVIDRNGDIYRCVPDEGRAWHAGMVDKPLPDWLPQGQNPNEFTLGVELVGNPDDYTDAQITALVGWLRYEAQHWGFPLTNICAHSDLYSQRRDPGPMTMTEIRRRLA